MDFYPDLYRLRQNFGGVKEVHVLRMGESPATQNRRAEIDVHLRHLPRPHVLRKSH